MRYLLPGVLLLMFAAAHAQVRLPERDTFYLTPTVEDLFACDEGLQNSALTSAAEVNNYCIQRKLDAATGVSRLLDRLEPGGPKGQVQLGFVATLQLLALYKRDGPKWVIDDNKLDVYLQLLTKVKRPVVVYLAADHFDSQGPLTGELLQDPRNLMLLGNGKPALSSYFGYKIVPYTLETDDNICVNFYRFGALKHVAKRLGSLPKTVQDRIVAVTLAGELHHMFPDFESGTGRYDSIQVTDYSAASVAGFQRWLSDKYQNLDKFNTALGTNFASFQSVPAPAADWRKGGADAKFFDHYDAYADGTLPIAGWLWDPLQRLTRVDLYVDGAKVGPVSTGFNRLDVYRALAEVTTPNVGFRYDLNFSKLKPGQHVAQVVGAGTSGLYLLGSATFTVKKMGAQADKIVPAATLADVKPLSDLANVKAYLDLPKADLDVYFNGLARDWNQYRAWQVRRFLERLHTIARDAGLPANKIYSHQVLPHVNSSWNPQLFAVDQTLAANVPWRAGINLYGGATESDWVRRYMAQRKFTAYGVPEFNPQQWKRAGAHLAAMRSHTWLVPSSLARITSPSCLIAFA